MGETGDITTGFTQPLSPHPSKPQQARTRSHAKLPRIDLHQKTIPFGQKGIEVYEGMKAKLQDLDTASASVKISKTPKFDTVKKRQFEHGKAPRQVMFDLGEHPETKEKTKLLFTDSKGRLEKDLKDLEENPTYSQEEKVKRQTRLLSDLHHEIEKGRFVIQTKREGETEIISTKKNLDDIIVGDDKKIVKKECSDEDMKAFAAITGEFFGAEAMTRTETSSEHHEIQEETQEQEPLEAKEHEKKVSPKPTALPRDETEAPITQREKKDTSKERVSEKEAAARQYAEVQREEQETLRAEKKRDERAAARKQEAVRDDITRAERTKKEDLEQPMTESAQEQREIEQEKRKKRR